MSQVLYIHFAEPFKPFAIIVYANNSVGEGERTMEECVFTKERGKTKPYDLGSCSHFAIIPVQIQNLYYKAGVLFNKMYTYTGPNIKGCYDNRSSFWGIYNYTVATLTSVKMVNEIGDM